MRPSPGGRARRLLRVGATMIIVVVGWIAGIVAAGVAAPGLADVRMLAAVGLGGCLLVTGVLVRLTTRAVRHRRRHTMITALAAALVLAIVGALVLVPPLPSGRPAGPSPAVPEGVRSWDLATGSRLAYRHLAATGRARPTPVIIIGGGPGEAIVSDPAKAAPFAGLAALGFDTYLYDQLGAGLSTRLTDPAGYTVARHIADLEAIRRHLGADQLILVSASWGGSLAAGYLAAHPTRVARAVVTSPAPMDYARWPDSGDVTSRLPDEPRQQALALLPEHPRFLTWYALGMINPRAAHDLVPDAEADAFFDTFLELVRPATVCDPAKLHEADETGNGLYGNVFAGRDAQAGAQSDVPQRLRTVDVPVLIITGECNYIPWAPTAEYATTLPRATLVCLPRAGHAGELDQPQLYRRLVHAFLLDRPLPHPRTAATEPCHP